MDTSIPLKNKYRQAESAKRQDVIPHGLQRLEVFQRPSVQRIGLLRDRLYMRSVSNNQLSNIGRYGYAVVIK